MSTHFLGHSASVLWSWVKPLCVGVNPSKIVDMAFPWELQKLERCAGRAETHFQLRWRKAAFCNLLLDPYCAIAKTGAEKAHSLLTCSFSPESSASTASAFTVLHPGTIWILNLIVFLQGDLVSSTSELLFQILLYLLHSTNVQLGIFSSLSLPLRSEEDMSEFVI